MRDLRKLIDLDSPGRLLLAQSFLLLPLVGLMLKLLGFGRSQRILAFLFSHNPPACENQPEMDIKRARRAAWLVNVAADRGFYRANCLERSLALWCVLGRQGVDSRIRLGSRKISGQFEAHAWVEVSQVIVNDDEDVLNRYAPFNNRLNSASLETE